MDLFERIRRWIDGDADIDGGEAWSIHSSPQRKSDFLAVQLAQEIARLMETEMFSPPGGPAHVPPRYIIYLSKRLDRLWVSQKRKLLLNWITSQIGQRASELTRRQLPKRAIHLEIRADGTLQDNEFRIQHLWSSTLGTAAATTNGKRASEEGRQHKVRAFGG